MLIKRLCLAFLASLFAVQFAVADSTVIAYWAQNDNDLPGGAFGFLPASFPQAADVGDGTIALANFNEGVDANGAYACIASFAGSTLNAQSGFDAGGSLSPQGCESNSNNGMQVLIAVDTSGFEGIEVSWAQRGTSSGFTSRQFAWSADGGQTFADFGSDDGALGNSFQLRAYDLSAITALDDNPAAVFRITLDGATTAGGNNRFDNITVTGTPSNGGPGDPGGPSIPYVFEMSDNPYQAGWSVQNVVGPDNWGWNSTFANVSFTGFVGGGNCTDAESWFISPGFDLDAQDDERLFVDVQRGFGGSDNLDLLFSADYDGAGDPNAANWILLQTVVPGDFSANNSPVTFGPFTELRQATGTGYFAARGQFEGASGCSTWRISAFEIDIEDSGGPDPDPEPFACVADPADDSNVTRLHAVQGAGNASPLAGETVEVQAVVVGTFQDSASFQIGGFFLQEPDDRTDSDPMTSEGLFISQASAGITVPEVTIGDEVRLRGQVREQFGQTELFQVSRFALCAPDQLERVTPAELTFPVDDLAELEAVEGMWVRLPQAMAVTEVFNAARFAEFTVAPDRLFQPTQVVAPGAPANALQDLNDRSRLIIDQGLEGAYRTPFQPGLDGSPLNATNPIRAGYRLQADFEGVMGFGFSNYRLFALQPAEFDDSENPRLTETPALPEGNLRVASFNVENLFATIQTGGVGCGPNFLNCRGATSESELARQLIKVSEALIGLNADVVGLIEIENDANDETLALLIDALNAVDAVGDWAFIPTGFQGTDAIKNAVIYRSGIVSPVGETAILDGSVVISPPFDDSRQRPVITQAFEHATGEVFAVSVFHLRSKNCGSNASGANLDQGDGQGCWNALRTESVQSWLSWIVTDPTATGTERHLAMGDFNAYGLEDPMQALMDAGYINQAMRFNDNDPAVYSYIFQGQSGSLDHVLASPTMSNDVLGAVNWAINADEIPAFAYPETLPNSSLTKPADFFAEDPFRSSDHDPLILSIQLEPAPAWVQVAHLAPFADGLGSLVDVAVNGEVVLPDLAYGESTAYLPLAPGLVDIDITPVGAADPAIAVTIELESGVYYTAVASGDGFNQPLDLTVMLDDLSAPAAGQFKLRLGHLAPFAAGAASAEVRTSVGDLVTSLDYAEVDGYVELPAGSYDLVITAAGGEPVLIDPIAVDFAAGDIVSVFAAGDNDNQRLGVFALPADAPGSFVDLNAGIELADLVQTFSGNPIEISVTTEPADLAVEVRYDGASQPPSAAGNYLVEVTVVEPGFVGQAEAELVILPAEATVELSMLSVVFNGQPQSPVVTTTPVDLPVALTFDGSSTPPSEVGDYIVTASVTDANFTGQASAIFRILSAEAGSLNLAQQPSAFQVIGRALNPALVVELLNGAGEVVVDDNSTVIQLSLVRELGQSTTAASVFAQATVTNGVAVFDNLVVNEPGGPYRLLVNTEDGSLPTEIGQAFEVLGDALFQDRFEQALED